MILQLVLRPSMGGHLVKATPLIATKPNGIPMLCIRNCVAMEPEESQKPAGQSLPLYNPITSHHAPKRCPGPIVKKQDPDEDEKLCVFLIEKALSKLPASKQDILGIFDLRGFGTENADLKFLVFLFDVFYYYYPRRLGQVLFVDAPFVFKPLWHLVKPMLKSYASLVRFCSAKEVREEYFTAETVPASFRK